MTEEFLLRENIRKIIKHTLNKRQQGEKLLRNLVQIALKEAAVESKIPHDSTGINILEELLKKIIPVLQDSYLSLTTSQDQRNSFSNHIMNAVKNSLVKADTNADALSEAITLDIADEEDEDPDDEAPPEFIDIEDDEVEEEEEIPEEEEFASGVEDSQSDKTGRNIAFQTYKQIEQQILDAYGILGNDEDRSIFREYLLINLKLYFQNFEKEMSNIGAEDPNIEIPAGSEEAAGEEDISAGEEDMGMDELGF